jgi:hypothetical protein
MAVIFNVVQQESIGTHGASQPRNKTYHIIYMIGLTAALLDK